VAGSGGGSHQSRSGTSSPLHHDVSMQSHMSPDGFQDLPDVRQDQAIFGSNAGGEEGWDALGGDYYREPDNIVRGVHMGFEDIEGLAFGSLKSCEDADIFGFDPCEAGADPFPPLVAFNGLSDLSFEFPGENAGAPAFPVNYERFTEADIPPQVPTDVLFRFQATTIVVRDAKPFHLGNQLLDFFSRGCDLAATITKVNQKKYAIKVDVSWGNITCSLKVRIYQDLKRQSCSVEFQRRGGDAATFLDAYEQASVCLADPGPAKKERSLLLQHNKVPLIIS